MHYIVDLKMVEPTSDRPAHAINTDFGPENHNKYISVQEPYISHFLESELYTLAVARNPPNLSGIKLVGK